eukprot:s3014_g7.t1
MKLFAVLIFLRTASIHAVKTSYSRSWGAAWPKDPFASHRGFEIRCVDNLVSKTMFDEGRLTGRADAETYDRAFDEWDADSDDTLSEEELVQGLKSGHGGLSGALGILAASDPSRQFHLLDADGDGVISRTEFGNSAVQAVQAMAEPASAVHSCIAPEIKDKLTDSGHGVSSAMRGPGLEENWRRPPFPWRVREPERPERSAVPDSTARDPSACHSFAMLAKDAKCASSKAFELEMTSALSVSLGTRRQWMMCASPIRALQARQLPARHARFVEECRAPVNQALTANNQCAECNPGYLLGDDMLCKPFTCLEGPGALCKLCSDQSKRTGQNQCSLCNPGYFLAGDLTCKPYTCETGAADACKTCRVEGDRTGHSQCAECNPGYGLTSEASCEIFTCTAGTGFLLADDSTCQAILCETGPGALCKKCQNPKDSTADDQCIECNDGYQLTADFKCSPFTCSTGPNTGCKLCRGESKRTANEQCQECKPGYSLTVDHYCEPFVCDEGPGTLCKRCLDMDTRTGDDQCAECNPGYALTEDLTCSVLQCSTGTGAACKVCKDVAQATGPNQCSQCNDGFELLADGTCRQYSCRTGSGNMCKVCRDPRHRRAHSQCAACNEGFALNEEGLCVLSPCSSHKESSCQTCGSGDECQKCRPGYQLTPSFACRPWFCRTGGGSLCKSCRAPLLRTAPDQCESCNPGFALSGAKCQPFSCQAAPGPGCKKCRSQSERTAENQCDECNAGYDDFTCSKYLCSTGQGPACKTCKPSADLTADDQCEACNPGYGLTADFQCQPLLCAEGKGSKCAICRERLDRTKPGQCLACNPGHTLSADFKCVAIECRVGDSSTDCKVCAAVPDRTTKNHCSGCNAGSGLVGTRCEPLTCKTGPGAACKMCLGKGERADFDQCKSCNPGYALNSEKKCEPFQCAVGEGSGCKTCRPQEARTDHDECESCNPGFFLSNSNGAWTCEAYSCTTGEGKECKVCQEKGDRTDHGQCAACNDGYELLSNGKCQPFTCKTGLGMGCKACRPSLKLTAADQCAQCNEGYFLGEDSKCHRWNCEVGDGSACKACFVQGLRTGHNQCALCNPGYFRNLSDLSCQPFPCNVGNGTACSSCLQEAERSMRDQCSACNPGYELTDQATCRPYSCKTGDGSACVSCKEQAERTGDVDCAECNPGYFIAPGSGCQAYECNATRAGCKSCRDQSERSAQNQCAECKSGLELTDDFMCKSSDCTEGSGPSCKKCGDGGECSDCNVGYFLTEEKICQPYKCSLGPPPLCKTCRDAERTTADNQCEECAAGYHLSEALACVPYSCTTGLNSTCKTCKAVEKRVKDDECASCKAGYQLTEAGDCRAFTCSTGNGSTCKTCQDQSKRTGNFQCASCNSGYTLQEDLTCKRSICEVGDLQACKTCDADSRCATCNDGFQLTASRTCEAIPCDVGEGSACAACMEQEERTKVNHCASCNPGHQLSGGTCKEYKCIKGFGDACRSCVALAERTADFQCSSCNPGYVLEDGKCVGFACSIGEGSGCKACRDQSARTADGQCGECNPGFGLTESFKCQQYTCSTGPGMVCKTCRALHTRSANDQCLDCNPGHFLTDDFTCAAFNCDEGGLRDDGTCRLFTCRAGPGELCKVCRAVESRSANDQCDSCNSGYFLDDDSRCRPFICKEDSGSCRRCLPQKLVWQSKMALSDTSRFKGLVGRGSSCLMFECHRLRSRRVAHGQCKRCNPGFELTQHKSCRPYSCRLGEATNCAECLEQPLRSGVDQCKKCLPGYRLTHDLACVAYTCRPLTTNALLAMLATGWCKTCRPAEMRTAHDQCAECNPGYGLDESGRCSAYECKTGEADQCKTCKAFELRTGHNQCAECNEGYGLTPSSRCAAEQMKWLPRFSAVMYTKEVVKKVFRELDLNGDGKITADEFSKKEVDAAVEADACPQQSKRFFEFQHDRSPGDTDLAAIDKVFERLDADQDELLSLPEFNAGARNREVKASDLFQSIDSDGNGRDDFVSQSEFLQDARTHYPGTSADDWLTKFGKLDRDADGKLSRIEWQGADGPVTSFRFLALDWPMSLLRSPVQWYRTLSQSYSWKLLAMVACTNHLLKGFVAGGGDEGRGLIGKPAEFLFSELGMSAGRLQALKAVAIVPFALKPVIALLSDAFPICGYHKLPYVVIFTIISFASLASLGFGFAVTEAAVVSALFLAFLQVAGVDVLMAAKQSEEVKKQASLGPDFYTYTWLGQVLSVCFLGPVIAVMGARAPYRFAAPLVLVVLWPALGNFMGEKRELTGGGLPWVFRQHGVLCALTLMIGVLAFGLVVSTFLLDEHRLPEIAACMAAVVLGAFALFIRREIAGPVIFFFLLGLLSTDSAAEFSEGPHFTPHFYITGIGAASFLGITVGFATGPEIFRSWSYRSICMLTLVLRACTQLAMLPVLCRWTLAIGIPDSLWLLVVMGLDSMVQAWRWIPKQVLAAHLAPRGVEATTLGLHAGAFNMASILSSYIGGYLLTFSGDHCKRGVSSKASGKCSVLPPSCHCCFCCLYLSCCPSDGREDSQIMGTLSGRLVETRVQVQDKVRELADTHEQLNKKSFDENGGALQPFGLILPAFRKLVSRSWSLKCHEVMVLMIYASPTARKTAQADDLDNSTTSATDSEGAACPHSFYVRNTFIECCESDGEVGSARCRASSAPAERRRQNGDATDASGGDAFEAQRKLEAAFQEAEELKDLIREADAERDTLHDQLKQMRHESCSFRVPEGVDEMIGTVTELTQKLDAASMDLQSARDYYNHVKLRIGLKKDATGRIMEAEFDMQEINEKAEERDRLKAECLEVKDQVEHLQHECNRLHQEIKDMPHMPTMPTDEGYRKHRQPPKLKPDEAAGTSRESLRFQAPEAKAKAGGSRKCKRGTGHHQHGNKASREDDLGVGATDASLQEIVSCQRHEHKQRMHGPQLAAGSSDIHHLACEQTAPADNLKRDQFEQPHMRDTTSDITFPAASEQDDSKPQEPERPSQCAVGIFDFPRGRAEGEQPEPDSPSQHVAGTSLINVFDACEQDQSKLELDKVGRSDISSLDDCEQDKTQQEPDMPSRNAGDMSDVGTEAGELGMRGQELDGPREDAAGMSGSKQKAMDEPGEDLTDISGTHGCAESAPPLLPTAESMVRHSDQEMWQAAAIPADETSGCRAQVMASRKDVESNDLDKNLLGEATSEGFKAASASVHEQAVLVPAECGTKMGRKSSRKGSTVTVSMKEAERQFVAAQAEVASLKAEMTADKVQLTRADSDQLRVRSHELEEELAQVSQASTEAARRLQVQEGKIEDLRSQCELHQAEVHQAREECGSLAREAEAGLRAQKQMTALEQELETKRELAGASGATGNCCRTACFAAMRLRPWQPLCFAVWLPCIAGQSSTDDVQSPFQVVAQQIVQEECPGLAPASLSFWTQLQTHFFEAQSANYNPGAGSKLIALMAGLEGLGMLMKNLDSTYTCPVQAAKHFKLVAELALANGHLSRARCLMQLGNIFKIQAMARWYNALPDAGEPRLRARGRERLFVAERNAAPHAHANATLSR